MLYFLFYYIYEMHLLINYFVDYMLYQSQANFFCRNTFILIHILLKKRRRKKTEYQIIETEHLMIIRISCD